jgi:glycosyltransferase involved in cell wall biosynthesis
MDKENSAISDLLLITQVFHPDRQATSQLLSDLCARLASRETRVSVLCGYPLQSDAEGAPTEEVWKSAKIFRGGVQGNFKASLRNRIMAYARFSLWVMRRLLTDDVRSSTVAAVTNPPFLPIIVFLCCFIRRKKYLVILHDVYPDGLVAVGLLRAGSLVARTWQLLLGLCLRRASVVVVLGRDMRDYCRRVYRVSNDRLAVVENWSVVPFENCKAAHETSLWRRLGLRGNTVVQYSGNMGLWHDINTIIESARLLAGDESIIFLLIGNGVRRKSAEALSQAYGLRNVIWLEQQSIDELEDTLACCHMAIISQRENLQGLAVPSKLYGVLAAGRAVVAQVPIESEVAYVVREERCGIVVPPGDSQALAAAIKRLTLNASDTKMMSWRARDAYRNRYGAERSADQFRLLFWEASLRDDSIQHSPV